MSLSLSLSLSLLDIKESFAKQLDTDSRSNDTDDTLVKEQHRKRMATRVKKQSVVLAGSQGDIAIPEYGMLLLDQV